eukprot:6196581-Pleurochrysis_carterae.AAC.3
MRARASLNHPLVEATRRSSRAYGKEILRSVSSALGFRCRRAPATVCPPGHLDMSEELHVLVASCLQAAMDEGSTDGLSSLVVGLSP